MFHPRPPDFPDHEGHLPLAKCNKVCARFELLLVVVEADPHLPDMSALKQYKAAKTPSTHELTTTHNLRHRTRKTGGTKARAMIHADTILFAVLSSLKRRYDTPFKP